MYKLILTVALGAVLGATSGCDDRDDDFHAHYSRSSGHVCSHDCHDHYYDGGKVVVIREGHRHGPNCGHHWESNRWVIVKGNRGGRGSHVCTRRCDHYYDGGKLVVFKKGHRHGDHCGHHWDGKRWVLAKLAKAVLDKRHRCSRDCHDHYYDSGKIVVIKGGHRHDDHCGHRWDGKRWVLAKLAKAALGRNHRCSRDCHDHYFDGKKIVVIKGGHRHGVGCGHDWDGRRWIVAKLAKAVLGRDHRCSRNCHDHYYDGGKLIVIKKGHRHGRDCGHDWDGKRWILAKLAKAVIKNKDHRCTRGCNDHYYDRRGKLVVIKNHRHGDKCGHRWEGDRWVLTLKGKIKQRRP